MAEVANLNTRLTLESASFISGIEKSRGAVRSLIASIDPAAAAQAKFNRETGLLEGAMKRGQISAEAYARGMEVLKSRLAAATVQHGAIVQSSGNVRAGMQQLGFQLSDVATQWASGTKPMIIFAQQSGQVIQALGMMTNSTKGLLGFLGGPWGQILTAAAVVMVPLIDNLLRSADAGDAAADSVKNYADALKELQQQGGTFEFGSDKFKKVSEEVLTAEGRVAQLEKRLKSVSNVSPIAVGPGGPAPVSNATVAGELAKARQDLESKRGDLNALLIQRRNREDLDRPAPERQRRARRTRTPADRSDQRLERFDDQAAQLMQQRLGLLQAITSDVRQQADYQHQAVELEMAAYRTDLDHQVAQKEVTAEKAKELLALKQRNTELQHTQINWRLDDQLTQQGLELTRSRLENENTLKEGSLDLARTQDERRRIQLEILENERQMQLATLEAVKARHASTDVEYEIAQKKIDQLNTEFGQQASRIRSGTMGPMEAYLDRLPQSAAELKERFEAIKVDALNNGLELASQNIIKLKGFAGQLFNQLIADVIRLNIQSALTGGGGSILGKLGSVLGLMSSNAKAGAAGAQLAVSKVMPAGGFRLPGMASGGSFRISGTPGIDRNVLSVNGVPRAMVSHNENVSVGYGNDNRAGGIAQIVPSKYFDVVVDQRSAGVAGSMLGTSSRMSAKRGRQKLA